MKIVCSPKPNPIDPADGISYSLFQRTDLSTVGRVGATLPSAVSRLGIIADPKAWDFLAFAVSVVAADKKCLRSKSADGWTREIELSVSVVDPGLWQQQTALLEKALKFLTGDIWNLDFCGGGIQALRQEDESQVDPPSGDVVCLLSGGVDSLIGAINLVKKDKRRPVLVSQIVRGALEKQEDFASSIGNDLSHIQLNHVIESRKEKSEQETKKMSPWATNEMSKRARSVMFLALGLLAATSLPEYGDSNTIDLVVPENGFISLNVPLTKHRLGSLSSRTTHPYFLSQMQSIWNSVGFNVQITNPYQFKTKGEMLSECCDQELLQSLVFGSESCGKFFKSNEQRHCGRCVPCLTRRAAFLHWGKTDQTEYRLDNLKLVSKRDSDDIQSVAEAARFISRKGVKEWAGASISYAQLGDVGPYLDIAARGIDELKAYLEHAGCRDRFSLPY